MALMVGWRYHGSVRSVLSAICALALAGAWVTCVINASALRLKPDRPSDAALGIAVDHRSHAVRTLRLGRESDPTDDPAARQAGTRRAALPALPTEPYSNGNHHADVGVACTSVTLTTRWSLPIRWSVARRGLGAGSQPGAATGFRRPPPGRPSGSRRTAGARDAAARQPAVPMTAVACARRRHCRRRGHG